jgi:hypothetical protein
MIEVPTLGGKAEIELPEGTQHGKTFRLRGKGIKGIRSSYPGDLYCHVTVETPVKLTEHQRKLLKELDESLRKAGDKALAQRQELDRPREGPVQVGAAGGVHAGIAARVADADWTAGVATEPLKFPRAAPRTTGWSRHPPCPTTSASSCWPLPRRHQHRLRRSNARSRQREHWSSTGSQAHAAC